jgi:hypothetical protein
MYIIYCPERSEYRVAVLYCGAVFVLRVVFRVVLRVMLRSRYAVNDAV